MAEVKYIPSIVHAPPATLLQVRKFYEVNFLFKFLLADFLMEQNLTFFFSKTNKNNFCSWMKSIKMHENPTKTPRGFSQNPLPSGFFKLNSPPLWGMGPRGIWGPNHNCHDQVSLTVCKFIPQNDGTGSRLRISHSCPNISFSIIT